MSRTLWLVRHGERLDFVHVEWFNLAPCTYDPPLSDLGQQQAQNLALRLAKRDIHHLVCSPFLRCLQTAYPLSQRLNLLLMVEHGLSEWLNVDWLRESPTLYLMTSLESCYPALDRSYQSGAFPSYPETRLEVETRIEQVLQRLLLNLTGNLVIIGHSITISTIIKALVKEKKEIVTPFACLFELVLFGDKWEMI